MDEYIRQIEEAMTFEAKFLSRIPWDTPIGVIRGLYHDRVPPLAAARFLTERGRVQAELEQKAKARSSPAR